MHVPSKIASPKHIEAIYSLHSAISLQTNQRFTGSSGKINSAATIRSALLRPQISDAIDLEIDNKDLLFASLFTKASAA